MRVDLKKFLFVGAMADRSHFFKSAQELGVVEFIDPKGGAPGEQDACAHNLLAAIKVLRGLPPVEQEEVHHFFKRDAVVQKILSNRDQLEKLQEEARLLRLEISRIEIFGNFSMEDIRYIETEAKRTIQFFCAKINSPEKVWNFPEVIKIGVDDGLDYFVAINRKPTVYPGMIEIKIDAPAGVLQKQLNEKNDKIHAIETELKSLARYNSFLHQALSRRMDEVHLSAAQEQTEQLIDGNLFAVEGWVPVTQIALLGNLCGDMHVHHEQIAFEEKDRIPTCLENEGANRLGEDLVRIYDTPSITDADPSPWVLWAFTLFFGMIISDAGYGLIFLGLSIYFYYKFPKAQGVAKRTIKLAILLSCACVVWGLLTTSFFGIKIGLDNPLRKVSAISWLVEKKAEYHIAAKDEVYKEWVSKFPDLDKSHNAEAFLKNAMKPEKEGATFSYPLYEKFVDNILFELALLIGAIHVCCSLLRNIKRHWPAVGWVIFIIGAYLYFPVMLQATSIFNFLLHVPPKMAETIGLQMIYAGIGIAVVLGFIQKKLMGALEIMTMIQITSDILSYLRLYALGLAGMIMATTFNEIADMVGVFFGVFVILGGHLINMSLAIMSGVIHGLRLNFLEWYHYSFEGGGKLFKPLALLTRKSNI